MPSTRRQHATGAAPAAGAPDSPVGRVRDALVRAAYRTSGGALLGRSRGAPLLLLTSTGHRTGRPRVTPVVHFRDGGGYVVAGDGRGGPPEWYHDLRGDPDCRLEVGRDVVVARAALPAGPEAARLRARLAGSYPRLTSSWRDGPGPVLVRLTPYGHAPGA